MGTSTRIATVAGLLLGLSGMARAQSATIHATATVLPAPYSDRPVIGDAAVRRVRGGENLTLGVDVPGAREFQVALRVERAADVGTGSEPAVIAERRVAAPKGGRREVEVPLPAAVLADLPDGQARARCTIYYGFDGSR